MGTRKVHFQFAVGGSEPAAGRVVKIGPTARFVTGATVNLPDSKEYGLSATGELTLDLETNPQDSDWVWGIQEQYRVSSKVRIFEVPEGETTLEYSEAPAADPGPSSPDWGPVATAARQYRDEAAGAAAAASEIVPVVSEARDEAVEAAAAAEAFGGTNNAQVAAMVTGSGPTKDALSGTYVTIPTLGTVLSRIDGAKLQSRLLGNAMRKLRKGEPCKYVTRGDSTTYGHDTVSADAVPAPTTVLPDGSKHSFTRSPAPWPSVLEANLNAVYGNTVTVENQGYSGDWVKRGYDRWTNNANAQITIISYGINDASASYVPDEFRGNVEQFVEWHEKMILRDLAWGSAVVLLTSTRQMGSAGNLDTDTFRNALQALATEYGIPLIDGEQFLLNARIDCWSDGNHLTTKGNAIMGARVASLFVGEGPQHASVVTHGSKRLGRRTLDNVILRNSVTTESAAYETPKDSASGNGFAIYLASGALDGSAYWSFYTESADVVICPIGYVGAFTGDPGVQITYELDFGVEQGQNFHDKIIDPVALQNPNRPSASSVHGPVVGGQAASYQANPKTAGTFLRVSTPGWHTVRARLQRGLAASAPAVHALEFIGWREWTLLRAGSSAAVVTASAYHQQVPAVFNEGADILTTKVSWPALLATLGIPSWGTTYVGAPALKLTVRSYAQGVIQYMFICGQRPDAAGVDVAATAVGSTTLEQSGSAIPAVKQLAAISTRSDVTDPGSNSSQRELASIAYEAATQSLVLTWRTTNSSNAAAKNMVKNFVMDFTVL